MVRCTVLNVCPKWSPKQFFQSCPEENEGKAKFSIPYLVWMHLFFFLSQISHVNSQEHIFLIWTGLKLHPLANCWWWLSPAIPKLFKSSVMFGRAYVFIQNEICVFMQLCVPGWFFVFSFKIQVLLLCCVTGGEVLKPLKHTTLQLLRCTWELLRAWQWQMIIWISFMCFLELDFNFTFSFVLEHETSKRKIKHYKFLLCCLFVTWKFKIAACQRWIRRKRQNQF